MPKLQKVSVAWQYFQALDQEEEEVGNPRWETHKGYACKECGKVLWYARKRGTIANMKGHLMQHHELWKELREKEEQQVKSQEGSTELEGGKTQSTLRDFARTITTPG